MNDSPSSAVAAPSSAAEARAERAARRDHWEAHEGQARRAVSRLSNARLAVFVLGGVGSLWLIKTQVELWWLLVLPFGAFSALVMLHQSADARLRRASRNAAQARFRRHRLEERWSELPPPTQAEQLDADHLFADDLDLSGEGSLLSLLGAPARTLCAPSALLRWLTEAPELEAARARQADVASLAQSDAELEQAAALPELDDGHEQLLAWAESPARPPTALDWLGCLLLGAAALVAAIWWAFFDGSLLPLGLVAAIEALLDQWSARRVAPGMRLPGVAGSSVLRLLGLLELLSQAPPLMSLRASSQADASRATEALRQLRRALDANEDARHNAFLGLASFLLRLHVLRRRKLEAWRAQHGAQLGSWLSQADTFESLLLLAAYRRDHPEDATPELLDGPPRLVAEALMHPLLPLESGVRNDLELGDPTRLLVISGSNMSGKSTFLRALGTNLALAFAGAPVRAARLSTTLFQIGASLRARDSLLEGRSRFMAEIETLKNLEQATHGPLPLLALLDELLAGTNSSDRLAGARALLDHLLEREALVLLTTHDLALTELAPGASRPGLNVHFLDDLRDGKPHFDHKLRAGVVPRGNGLELMRSLGLPV